MRGSRSAPPRPIVWEHMKVLVIGGTLFIGRQLVEELVKAGHDVTVLHRKPKHDFGRRVENIMADRNDAAQPCAKRWPAGGSRWYSTMFTTGSAAPRPRRWRRRSSAVRRPHHAVHLHVERGGLRRRAESLRRAIRWRRTIIPIRTCGNKATTERLLFRMHAQSGLPGGDVPPAVRLRAANNPFYREPFFWDRLRAGRPIIIPGDGHRLMQFVYVNDLVQAMVRVDGRAAGGGRGVQYRRSEAADAGGSWWRNWPRRRTWSRRWCACRAT